MRKVLFSLLLATTMSSPALAADRPHGDHSGHNQARSERSEPHQSRSDDRNDRAEARVQAEAHQPRADVREQAEARQAPVAVREQAHSREGFAAAAAASRFQQRDRDVQSHPDQIRDSRQANVNERGRPTLRDQGDHARSVEQQRVADWRQSRGKRVLVPNGARPDRPAPLPQTAYNHHDRTPSWDRNWRNNSRYDWRRYRDHHRSNFHLGVYFDPFGWNYRRYNVGWRLYPNYYSSNYWLNDPSMYALPYAPYPYKWVRYYNDALLVNTYTGQVADVIYDFFW